MQIERKRQAVIGLCGEKVAIDLFDYPEDNVRAVFDEWVRILNRSVKND